MIKVRFAPSPTGALHIGGAHTALFNWLFVRGEGGRFVLRIEDTDRVRSTKEAEKTILDGLQWLGITWDEGPFYQSERLNLYRRYAEQLLENGLAYKEGSAIVFRTPREGATYFKDIVWGDIEVENGSLKDIVLIKSDGMPTYNFAVVVDDHTMGITHVIRGEDHIPNTPKQILIYKALGFEVPEFAHLPMILGPDKTKLSKRHGATAVGEYRNMGYLPEAVFYYLSLLGWSPKEEGDILYPQEIVKLFDLRDVTKRAAVFDLEKLKWINKLFIKDKSPAELAKAMRFFWLEKGYNIDDYPESYLQDVVAILQGRAYTLQELADYSDYLLKESLNYDKIILAEFIGVMKGEEWNSLIEEIKKIDPFVVENIDNAVRSWLSKQGMKLKDVGQALRYALTARRVTPGIFEVMALLGKDRVVNRLERAVSLVVGESSNWQDA